MKLSIDERILYSPTKEFIESKLSDNSLLVIALKRQKFNQVSDSGSKEPLASLIQGLVSASFTVVRYMKK